MSFELLWDPGWIGSQRSLERRDGDAEHFDVFGDALATARSTVKRDEIAVITWVPPSWTLWLFGDVTLERIDFDELALHEVPLGGSTDDPRTWLVDSRGQVAQIIRAESRTYVIDELDEDPDPNPPEEFIPAVTPHPMENSGRGIKWSPKSFSLLGQARSY